jgi:hypothetical protein
MHDAHAAYMLLEGVDQKLAQRDFRLGNGHAVQIDLTLHTVVAAPQPAQHCGRDLRTMKGQRFAGQLLRVRTVRIEALPKHGSPIGAREPCMRSRPGRPRWGCVRAQRPDTAHRLPEQPGVLGVLVAVLFVRQDRHAWLRYHWQLPV